jgi:hypothetical protein
MLAQYMIKCETCLKSFSYNDINQHEIACKQSVCSNELCSAKFLEPGQNRIRFNIEGVEYISCSKKCQKVTKFGLIMQKNDEH